MQRLSKKRRQEFDIKLSPPTSYRRVSSKGTQDNPMLEEKLSSSQYQQYLNDDESQPLVGGDAVDDNDENVPIENQFGPHLPMVLNKQTEIQVDLDEVEPNGNEESTDHDEVGPTEVEIKNPKMENDDKKRSDQVKLSADIIFGIIFANGSKRMYTDTYEGVRELIKGIKCKTCGDEDVGPNMPGTT